MASLHDSGVSITKPHTAHEQGIASFNVNGLISLILCLYGGFIMSRGVYSNFLKKRPFPLFGVKPSFFGWWMSGLESIYDARSFFIRGYNEEVCHTDPTLALYYLVSLQQHDNFEL